LFNKYFSTNCALDKQTKMSVEIRISTEYSKGQISADNISGPIYRSSVSCSDCLINYGAFAFTIIWPRFDKIKNSLFKSS